MSLKDFFMNSAFIGIAIKSKDMKNEKDFK